jgi:hypothetical protein
LSISPFPYEETSVVKQSETGLIEQHGAAANAGNTGNLFRASGDAMMCTPQLKGTGRQGVVSQRDRDDSRNAGRKESTQAKLKRRGLESPTSSLRARSVR